MRRIADQRPRMLPASQWQAHGTGGPGMSHRAFCEADWQPMLPSARDVGIGLLMGIAAAVERSAGLIGRAGWLAPLVVVALGWMGIAAAQS